MIVIGGEAIAALLGYTVHGRAASPSLRTRTTFSILLASVRRNTSDRHSPKGGMGCDVRSVAPKHRMPTRCAWEKACMWPCRTVCTVSLCPNTA